MESERINAAACECGPRHVYVFGGVDGEEIFLDSIERYNVELDIWYTLKVSLRTPLSNLFSFCLNSTHIVLLGGMKRIDQAV